MLDPPYKSVSGGPVRDPVAVELAKARKAWEKYQANRDYDKNAVYPYLAVVFDLVQRWKKQGVADEYSLIALKRHDFLIRMKADPYARVIYCTSQADPKIRSKWSRVMQRVAEHNESGRPFTEFVTKNGGLNNFAEDLYRKWPGGVR